jgi:hypothetical protein
LTFVQTESVADERDCTIGRDDLSLDVLRIGEARPEQHHGAYEDKNPDTLTLRDRRAARTRFSGVEGVRSHGDVASAWQQLRNARCVLSDAPSTA